MPIPAIEETIDNRPCWERISGEREKAFAAFQFFRDLGPSRTLPDVIKFVQASLDKKYELKERMEDADEGKRPGKTRVQAGGKRAQAAVLKTLYDWSSKYGWNERCDFYDRHMDRIRVNAAEKSIEQMVTRHLEIGTKAQKIAEKKFDKLLEPIFGKVEKKDQAGNLVRENGQVVMVDEIIAHRLDDIDPQVALRFADVGVKIERLAHGEPIDIRRNRDDGAPVLTTPHGAARDEVLQRIRKIATKKKEQAELTEHQIPEGAKPELKLVSNS